MWLAASDVPGAFAPRGAVFSTSLTVSQVVLVKGETSGRRAWRDGPGEKGSGGVLLSHTDDRAVPSALEGLTSEFGMGSGVAPPAMPPENEDATSRRTIRHHLLRCSLRALGHLEDQAPSRARSRLAAGADSFAFVDSDISNDDIDRPRRTSCWLGELMRSAGLSSCAQPWPAPRKQRALRERKK